MRSELSHLQLTPLSSLKPQYNEHPSTLLSSESLETLVESMGELYLIPQLLLLLQ